jgi:hypothetical protein
MKTAVCTLVIGDEYERLFRDYVWKGWENYCGRHNYRLHVFRKPFLQLAGKSFAWQKLFVLDQPEVRDFDRILWLDADILVKPGAPPVEAPQGKIGYVLEAGNPQTTGDWYAQFQLPNADEVVQTGVLFLEPGHSQILKRAVNYPETQLYEMPALSWCLSESKAGYHLDPRFNAVISRLMRHHVPVWILKKKFLKEALWIAGYPPLRRGFRQICEQSWFLHAAGAKRDLLKASRLLQPINSEQQSA